MTRKKSQRKSRELFAPNILYAFDIILMFRKDGPPSIHFDENVEHVINTILQDNQMALVKVNWSSPDVHVIIPPADKVKEFTPPPLPDEVEATFDN